MPDDYTHSMAYAGGPRFPLSSFIFFMKPSVFCIRHSAALSCALQWMASWRLLSFSFFPARRSPFLLSPRRIRLRFDRQVLKRYARLAIPVFFSCLSVYILLLLGLTYNIEAGNIVGREDWIGKWLAFQPSLSGFLYDCFVEVFLGVGEYNKFLWTMHYELIGSFVVFGILYFYRFIKYPAPVFFVAALLLWVKFAYIACFIFGVLYSQLLLSGIFERLRSSKAWFHSSILILALLVLFDTLSWNYIPGQRIVVLTAVLLTLVMQTNGIFEAAMCSNISRFLGHISFPIYLVHFPVIVSLMSYAIVKVHQSGPVTLAESFIVASATFLVCVVTAWAFTPIETMTNRICSRIAKLTWFGPSAIAGKFRLKPRNSRVQLG